MDQKVNKRRRGLLMAALSSAVKPGGVLGAALSVAIPSGASAYDEELVGGVIAIFNDALGLTEGVVYQSDTTYYFYDESTAPPAFQATAFKRVGDEAVPFEEGVGFYYQVKLDTISDYQKALEDSLLLDVPYDHRWMYEEEVSSIVVDLTDYFADLVQRQLGCLLYVYQMSPQMINHVLSDSEGDPESVEALKSITADTIVDFVQQILDICDLIHQGQSEMIRPIFNDQTVLSYMVDYLAPDLPGENIQVESLKNDNDAVKMILDLSARMNNLQETGIAIPESMAEWYAPIKRVWSLEGAAPDPFLLPMSERQVRINDLVEKIDRMMEARHAAQISNALKELDQLEMDIESSPSDFRGIPGIGGGVTSLAKNIGDNFDQVAVPSFNDVASHGVPLALPAPAAPEIVIVPVGQESRAEHVPVAKNTLEH